MENVKKEVAIKNAEHVQLIKHINEAKKVFEQIENTYTETNAEIQQLQEQRKKLFEAKSVDEEQKKWEKTLEENEKNIEQQRNTVKTISDKKQEALTQRAAVEKYYADIQKQLQRTSEKLEKQQQKAGFATMAAVLDALMDTENAKTLAEQNKKIEEQQHNAQNTLAQIKEELDACRKHAYTTESLEELEKKHAMREAELQTDQQKTGGINEKLAQDKKLRKESKDLIEQITNQQKECNRWAKLNALIGAHDGKKFRVFAQGLTLQRLTFLANKHLQNLNGRYVINKRKEEDLTLDIVDTFQANNVRSMHTLSGGESFLVSLALALGLSDLAGRNTQINSLFIDEGFGTLDTDTLDLAITTLENLQATGKNIGVISHVTALKERIATQIQVRKKGNGFSEVVIL